MTGAGGVRDVAHLKTLPDGTIITWLRIPGDPTSEAVAFVRREVETVPGVQPGDCVTGERQRVTVWITPGGWDPHTIEEAGVTFPCQVVRFGEFTPGQYPWSEELELFGETLAECTHGGTWARETALNAAARVHAGQMAGGRFSTDNQVIYTAEAFETWLERDPLPEVDSGMGQPVPPKSDTRWVPMNNDPEMFADQIDTAVTILQEANRRNGSSLTVGINLAGFSKYADKLREGTS